MSSEPLWLSIAHDPRGEGTPRHAQRFYKVVAVRPDGMFVSIFDGRTEYPLRRATRMRTGIYACDSIAAVVAHGRRRLPRDCALLDAPRAILRVHGWLEDGSAPVASATGKYRLDAVMPVAAIPWSSVAAHARLPPQTVAPPPTQRPATAPPRQGRSWASEPAPRSPAASLNAAESWRQSGTRRFSEHMQAGTAQLHEDVLAMQETLQGLRVRAAPWPLHDIHLFIRGMRTSQYHSWHSIPPLSQPPTRCMLQSILRNVWFPPTPSVLPFNVNVQYCSWQYRVKAKPRLL